MDLFWNLRPCVCIPGWGHPNRPVRLYRAHRAFATLEDAEAGINPIASHPITTDDEVNNRDLALRIANGFGDYYSFTPDRNTIQGAWWYTTAENTNELPKDDPDGDRYYTGWGNRRGNAGMGYIQIRDIDSVTHTSLNFAFQDFDGTFWTTFSLSLTGAGAGLAEQARLNIDGQGWPADQGYYHYYDLTLTAGGLEGQANETTPLLIEAFNHPTSVTGSFVGLFENTNTDELYQDNVGFYTFDLTINMISWAYEQGDEELNGNFVNSYFGVVIPEPGTTGLLLLGAGLLFGIKGRTGR